MELVFSSEKLKTQCHSMKEALKLFHDNKALSLSLLSRINALEQAPTIKTIVVQPTFHFHKLHDKGRRQLGGYFAIDIKSRRDAWRIILQPLNNNKEPYVPCNIDEIADIVRIVEITEVSKHYE